MELAAELGLGAEDFADIEPTGQGEQYIVKDVRKASKAKIAASKQ